MERLRWRERFEGKRDGHFCTLPWEATGKHPFPHRHTSHSHPSHGGQSNATVQDRHTSSHSNNDNE